MLQLGVLKLGVLVYTLQSKEAIMSGYKEVFDGVGKLKTIRSSNMSIPMYPRWLSQSGALRSASAAR